MGKDSVDCYVMRKAGDSNMDMCLWFTEWYYSFDKVGSKPTHFRGTIWTTR